VSALDLVVFAPLAGALVLTLLPRENLGLIRSTALVSSLVTFALSLPVLFAFDGGVAGFQLVTSVDWIPEWGVAYITGIDGVSLWMVMLTVFLMPLAVLASWSVTERVKLYFALMLALETGLLGVFVALDLFLFYLFWEVSLVPMYLLIGMWGYGRRIYAAMNFFLFTLIGSLLMLAAIIFLYFAAAGSPTFDYRELLGTPLAIDTQRLLFLGFFASFAVKVPLVPLHTWLPDAHTEAPTAGSVLLAAVFLKLGAYGLIRFAIPFFPDAARELAPVVIVLATVGIIYGALVALVQKDLKRLIAYSSVAHLGFVVLGFFVGSLRGMSGGILQMLNHGLSTGALFMLVGALYDRRHTRLIADYGGLAASVPVLAGVFLFVALSSLGLPALNGFVGEFLVLLGTFEAYRWWVVPAAFGIVLAAIYLLWAYQRVFHGELKAPENRTLRDLDLRELAMLAPIVVLIVVIGVYPKPFLERIEPSARLVQRQLQSCSVDPAVMASARPTGPVLEPCAAMIAGEDRATRTYADVTRVP
jgi:NADH-quinone oxidoreductase subunit M